MTGHEKANATGRLITVMGGALSMAYASTGAALRWTLGAALFFGAHAAWAANLGFLNDTPMSYMKQADVDSIKKAAMVALNTKSDGDSMQWTNEGTGNSVKIDATLTPGDTTKTGDRTCRSISVALNAKGQAMNLHPQFCRAGSGQWQLQRKN